MTVAEAKERNIPIGEMVSKGEVRFEARENSWKNVEPFHFPVFRGVKIKTEKGLSVIALENMSQIEMGQQSMISFNQDDQLSLFHGWHRFPGPSFGSDEFQNREPVYYKIPYTSGSEKYNRDSSQE